jgi:opacity protein-like surface antigen
MNQSVAFNRRIGQVLAVVAAIAVFGTAAMAQVENPSQITIQGTALVGKETTNNGTTNNPTKSGGFLLGYSYQFNPWIGVEGNYGYTRNTQNYLFGLNTSSIQADFHELTGSFVAHIPTASSKIRPYALGGAGALIFDPTDRFVVNGAVRQTKAAFVYGGGVNFDVARNFGIRTEYRGLLFKVPDFTVPALNLDKITHLAQPSVGFYFRF